MMFELIKKTVKNAKSEVASFGEEIVDLCIDNEVLENVPFVDYAVKILTIRDVYKKNKVKRNYQFFIKSIQKMNENDIEEYLKILNNSIEKENIVETIFEIITEAEKPIKAEILGNLSVALSKKKITLENYYDLLLIIQAGSIPALKAIKAFMITCEYKGYINGLKSRIREESLLISLGIASRFGTYFGLDDNGKMLAEFGLKIGLK